MSNEVLKHTPEELSYPIGKFDRSIQLDSQELRACLVILEELPSRLSEAVEGLTDPELDTPYRPGGWTVRQLIHHVADSHMHSYMRFRFALTENRPLIKVYEEKDWATLSDARSAPVELSLQLLEGLHARWVYLLRSCTEEELDRTFEHPNMGAVTLRTAIGLYAWHSRHHLAHITSLRERTGW